MHSCWSFIIFIPLLLLFFWLLATPQSLYKMQSNERHRKNNEEREKEGVRDTRNKRRTRNNMKRKEMKHIQPLVIKRRYVFKSFYKDVCIYTHTHSRCMHQFFVVLASFIFVNLLEFTINQ